MVLILVDDVLEKRGRSRYWLAEEADMRYHNIMRICNGETSAMSFDVLERLCKALDCTPNDIFEIE